MKAGMKDRLMVWLVPRLIRLIIALVSYAIRWQYVGDRYDPADQARHFFAFWHARLLMMGDALRGSRGYMLISEHRDGGYIADTLHLQGFRTVRGSSTRGGARALLQMVRTYQNENCDFGITPDGPKGPREKAQMGTIQLAKKTGLPIRPVIWASKRQWRITSSWDHFYIPKPFTAGVIVYGDTVEVAADGDDQAALRALQEAMDITQQAADNYFS